MNKHMKKKSKREAPWNLIVVQLLIWIQRRSDEKKKEKTFAKCQTEKTLSFALLFTFFIQIASSESKNQ